MWNALIKGKDLAMKKAIICLVGSFFILSMVSAQSFADTDGSPDPGGKCCHEEGMPTMPPFLPPMRPHGEEMTGRPSAMPFVWRHLAGLELNEKQKDAVREIESKVVKDSIRKRAEIEVAELELKETLDKDSVDLTAVEAIMKKIESLRKDMRLAYIKAFEEIKSKLTPEQRKKFKEMLDMGPRSERMKHGGIRMPPPIEKREGVLQEKEQ
jgi:Spy/CpxP family protein refolding chaperone